jgi:hypothetical protein
MLHPATHAPAWQRSPVTPLQAVPSEPATVVHPLVLAVGWQLWQELAGFAALAA